MNLGLRCAGKLLLGFLGLLAQALHGHAVAGQVHTVLSPALVGQPADNALIEVIAAQEVIAAGGQHLYNTVPHANQRYIEGSAA